MRSERVAGFLGIVVGGVLLLFAGLAGAAGTDVQINADPPGTVQNEVRITQNATNPANLVVAYNDAIGAASSPLGVSFSADGGATWTDRQLGIPTHPLLPTTLPFIFDPFIDSDSAGTIYAGYIATDPTVASGPSGIYIESSVDGGSTWSGPTTIDFNMAAIGPFDPTYRFNDRSDMTMDGNDHLHVVWIKDVGVGLPTTDIHFAKSPPPGPPGPGNPTGLDFTGVSLGSVASLIVNDNFPLADFANAPDVAVAPDGTIYVAWIDLNVLTTVPQPATLKIDSSTTGGASWGPDTTVAGITALPRNVSTTSGVGTYDDVRSQSYPVIAVDPANSLTVYMAYAADPGDPTGADEADVFFIKSTDGGATWSAPVTVNDDGTANDQIHPTIAVRPNGTIDLAWYDKRNAANDDQWDVYAASSTDGGASFGPNRRITDQSFATTSDLGGAPWFGEYLGIEVTNSNAYLAFASGSNDAKSDVFFDLETFPADLSLTKAVDDPTPDVGNGVVFTLTVANAGSAPASGVQVTDLLPSGYTYVSDDGGGAFVPGTGIWTVGAIPSGSAAALNITASVNASGSYGNTAEVTAANEPDPDSTPANDDGDQSEDDEDFATTTPVPVADLSLTKTVDVGAPPVGGTVVFTVTAANAGPSGATGVQVTDSLPSGFTYLSDDGAGAYTAGTGVWAVGSLSPGSSAVLNVTATVNASGSYGNTAEVTAANEPDPDSAPANDDGDQSEDDEDFATTTPVPVADLSLTKTVDVAAPPAGGTVVFSVTVGNAGPSAATGVQVTDALPPGFTYVSDDGGGAYTAGTGVWAVGGLAAGNAVTLNITATVNATGAYRNVAEVTAANEVDPDSTPANDDGDQSEDDEDFAVAAPPTCNGLAATLIGTAGDDTLTGTAGDDVIVALAGDDTIDGAGGDDTICAGAGNDLANGGAGSDWIDGESGEDTATYATAAAGVTVDLGAGTALGGAGADTLTRIRHLIGSPFDDKLSGNAFGNRIEGLAGDDKIKGKKGDDTLIGGDGDDVLQGRQDEDTLNGGPGADTASYFVANGPVIVNLILGTATGEGTDGLLSIENVNGSRNDDIILGNGQVNVLIGFKGADLIDGRGGDDVLRGKPGDDELLGGSGDDRLLGGAGADIANGGPGGDDFCIAETTSDCERP